MTGSPRRLRDDPDFRWETGCDLADESFAVGGYDLPAVRARVLAEVTPPSGGAPLKAVPAARGWWAGLGIGVGMTALVAGALALATATEERVAPVATEPTPEQVAPAVEGNVPPAPPLETTAPIEHEEGPVLRPSPPPAPVAPPAPAAPLAQAAPPADAAEEPPAPLPPEPAGDDGAAAVDATPPPPLAPVHEAPASTLRAELDAYDRGAEALGDGNLAVARQAFESYLAAWPAGRLRDEASLGLLRTLVQSGDHAAVEGLAASLQELPGLASRRAEIVRMRAENLVWLERCDLALELAASLPSREGADVRRACRRR